MDGTSMAAPHVTGLVALIFEKNRHLTFEQVARPPAALRAHRRHPRRGSAAECRRGHAHPRQRPLGLGQGRRPAGSRRGAIRPGRRWWRRWRRPAPVMLLGVATASSAGLHAAHLASRLGDWRTPLRRPPGRDAVRRAWSASTSTRCCGWSTTTAASAVTWRRNGGPLLVRRLLHGPPPLPTSCPAPRSTAMTWALCCAGSPPSLDGVGGGGFGPTSRASGRSRAAGRGRPWPRSTTLPCELAGRPMSNAGPLETLARLFGEALAPLEHRLQGDRRRDSPRGARTAPARRRARCRQRAPGAAGLRRCLRAASGCRRGARDRHRRRRRRRRCSPRRRRSASASCRPAPPSPSWPRRSTARPGRRRPDTAARRRGWARRRRRSPSGCCTSLSSPTSTTAAGGQGRAGAGGSARRRAGARRPGRPELPPHRLSSVRFDRLGPLFSDPTQYLKDLYGFGRPDFDGLELFRRVKQLVDGPDAEADLITAPGHAAGARRLRLPAGVVPGDPCPGCASGCARRQRRTSTCPAPARRAVVGDRRRRRPASRAGSSSSWIPTAACTSSRRSRRRSSPSPSG